MQQSESLLPHFKQKDPVVRPFLRLPAPAYYASAAMFATGVNFLRWKMARSGRWHKIWWLPQVTSIAGIPRDMDTRERIRRRIDGLRSCATLARRVDVVNQCAGFTRSGATRSVAAGSVRVAA
jgi:hypothetical protein